MQEEIRSLQASYAAAVDKEPTEQTTNHISSQNLESIHECYNRVPEILREERCSMANALRLARCPRSTIWDFIAIAEVKIVNAREHELVARDHSGSVQQLEQACRKQACHKHLGKPTKWQTSMDFYSLDSFSLFSFPSVSIPSLAHDLCTIYPNFQGSSFEQNIGLRKSPGILPCLNW